jgi:hypothetical protein
MVTGYSVKMDRTDILVAVRSWLLVPSDSDVQHHFCRFVRPTILKPVVSTKEKAAAAQSPPVSFSLAR